VLLYGEFDLGEQHVRLESPAPDRRRIDVEVGALVIECKRDLRPATILREAEKQLAGYLLDRESANAGTYVGVLTDGITWRCYRRTKDDVEEVSVLENRTGQIDERRFRWWLGSILATEQQISPTATTINERLGSESPSCQLALKELAELWAGTSGHREVEIKRALWAKLLRTALGTQFEDEDSLFVEHTYLVLVATLIAHVVIGFKASDLQAAPATALSGQLFAQSGIRGVGEAGFFDWVLDVPGGEDVVVDIARRLSVFSWAGVDHDVLKALYQSVISPETRHRLGEYYTPDWLASRMVESIVEDPLESRVLDPACGSGTFVFHAVRRYLGAADAAGIPLIDAVKGVVEKVYGMDLHPVAVVLAQVTYLLAISTERITKAGVPLSIPIYLGDSMRWDAAEGSLLSASGEIVVPTGTGGKFPGMEEELRFPSSVVSDPGRFDRLVDALASRASERIPGAKPLPIAGVLTGFAVPESDKAVIEETYKHFCELHDEGRDHIWGFFVRNQARPTWFASPNNRVDVVLGNPPWLAYSYMPDAMQETFEVRSKARRIWVGGARGMSSGQDLSAYFVVRSVELYLRVGGRFAFVMPFAALSRKTYAGFREGSFSSPTDLCTVVFDTPWDLSPVQPSPFPVPSSVVFGTRDPKSMPLPDERVVVTGHLDPAGGLGADAALTWTTTSPGDGEPVYESANSPYARRFRLGAKLTPRMFALVEVDPPGPLQPNTSSAVRSRRGRLDRRPWKDLPDLTGVVEKIFVYPLYLGEHCLPFALLPPVQAVIPYDGTRLLSGDDERIDRYPGFATWWRKAEQVWIDHRSSDRMTLLERLNYINQLGAQLPVPDVKRIVYTKAGNYLTAAIVDHPRAIIDEKLYWAPARSQEEALYVTAILNSPSLGDIVRPYQSVGAFGPRDFDKYVWYPPIPEYNEKNENHNLLAGLAQRAEMCVGSIEIPSGMGFQRIRGLFREALKAEGILDAIDALVASILE